MDITIKQLEHRYGVGTPFERTALSGVNLSVTSGTFLALIGHTGSGKSTLIQHLNGLLKPSSGSVTVGEKTIRANEKAKHLKPLRKKVGMVFQYPEHQLFEETVEKDICFGPINFGVPEKRAKRKAREILPLVGLDETLLQKSPFDLSGGQMRRVAIAGVLAIEPEVLVLDEPTAGLDPRGQREVMEMFYRLHKEKGLTTIFVTHSMENAAAYADEIVIMENGSIHMKGSPKEIFAAPDKLKAVGLDVPETVQFIARLEAKFGLTLPKDKFSSDEVAELAYGLLEKGARAR
jgi:energy-coupling factor transport system ATP-binding protein